MADNYSVTVTLKGQNQLSQPVGQAQQSLRGLTQEATRTNDAMSRLKSIGAGIFTGVAIAGAVRFGEELYQNGMAAQRAETMYRSFGMQVGNTTALLDRLREASRGVVTDVDLMNSASSMLSMGLAKNADDVERLTRIGVTFAQAMGTDVASSMANLNSLLANQSLLRLDTLGISSAQVRELWNQYKAAGVESGEAFTKAFLEVAEGKLPQMSAVAASTVTPFQELQTSMTNFMNDFGDNFAFLINEIAKGVRDLADLIAGIFGGGGGTPGMDVAGAQLAAPVYAQLFAASGINLTDTTTGASLNSQNITGALTAAILANQVGMDAGSAEFLNLLTTNAFGFSANDSLFNTEAGQAMLSQAASIVGWYESYMAVIDSAKSGAAEGAVAGRAARPTYYSNSAIQDMVGGGRPAWASIYGNANMYFDQLSFMSNSGGGRLFSPEEVAIARDLANEVQRAADTVTNLGLSDAIVSPMQEAAKQAGAMADNIERSNVAAVSLSELFGQTNGGQFDAINQAVLDQMRARGDSPEQIQAAAQQMGLRSGTMTGLSVQFDNSVGGDLADVYDQLGPEAYFQLQQAYIQFVRDMRTQNPDYTGAVPWDLIKRDAGINQQQGSAYTVQPGDTVWGLSQAAGMTVQEYMAANGLDSTMLSVGQQIGSANQYSWDPTAALQAADSITAAAEDTATIVDDMTTAVDTLSTGIQGVFNQQYDLPINLVITAAGRDAVTELVRSIVQANGGTAPGSSNYNSRGGSSGSIGQFAGGHKPT